jgi:quinol-cytochrome oxidoreductase complex cytochrome b subunit
MLSYLLQEPDALALALLLLFLAGALGLWLGRGRPTAAPPGTGEGTLVSTWPHLVRLELLAALAALLLLSWWAIALEAPLGPPADPMITPAVAKAPWFFVGLQELVSYSASFGGVAFPALLGGLLLFLPWLDGGADSDGEPLATRGARLAIPATAALTTLTAILGLRWWGDPQAGTSSWLNPASLAALAALAASLLAAWRYRSRRLLFQTLLAGLLVALLVFTVVGWLWRGPDWSLGWHPGPGRGVP